jgi:hypothetical protein
MKSTITIINIALSLLFLWASLYFNDLGVYRFLEESILGIVFIFFYPICAIIGMLWFLFLSLRWIRCLSSRRYFYEFFLFFLSSFFYIFKILSQLTNYSVS